MTIDNVFYTTHNPLQTETKKHQICANQKNLQYKQIQQSPLDAISFGFTATLFVILYVL